MADPMTAEQLRAELIALADQLFLIPLPDDDVNAERVEAVSRRLRALAARLSGMAAVPGELMQWGASLRADLQHNDHCTADPVFTVEKRRRIHGIDMDYSDDHTWIDACGECSAEECARLEAAYQETCDEPDGFTRIGYIDLWEHVASYITPEPARDLVAAKGKDYRVMVDSGYRNNQWKQLRAFLLALPAPAAPEPPHV